ncbi:MAG TPA: M42 family metallopeptidase [Solirubrobacteraceae bacterium]|nr:M42 family metallopeptidase [Solirubrobacteraceae bacterium]
MPVDALLRSLLTAAAPSGYEGAAAAVFRKACEPLADVSIDTVGSTVARRPGRAGGRPTLAVIGHIDEIGLIVSHIDDDGFLWILPVGGWDPLILVGQRVEVITRNGTIPGVIGKKPIHLMREDDRKKVPELRDLHIDVGARDGDEARALAAVGDVAVIAAEPVELPNRRVVSRSMDNRLGCWVAYEAMRLVGEGGGADADVCAVAVAQEETTFQGAVTTAYALRPDVALVIDVTHATDAPGIDEKENGRHPLGSGPAITRGTNLSPAVFDLLVEAAEAEEIPYTVEATGRATGTDGDAVAPSRAGIPTGVVGIPLRYMHSPVEMVQLDDLEATARLCAAFARRLTSDVSFVR